MNQRVLSGIPARLRLTLWYVVLLMGALLLFAGSVYVLMSRSLLTNLDSSLRGRIAQIAPSVQVVNNQVHRTPPDEDASTPYIPAALISASGHPISGILPKPFRLWLRQNGSSLPNSFLAATVGDLRFAIAPIRRNRRPTGYLVVWQSMESVNGARESLLLLLLGIGPGLLLLSGIGGMVLARRVLHPVAEITRTAESISVTDLHRRVPVGGARDELTQLAATFNAMIERLEDAVERERRFTGDASHELRAPLSVILAEASLALDEPYDSDTYRQALRIIHGQAAGMNEMIAALLTLARVESVKPHREVVPLAELVDRAIHQCAPIARERTVQVTGHLDPGLSIEGNPTLLTRAVRNLLDNAIKASPHGGTVCFQAQRIGAMTLLLIQDEGPGIEQDEIERIFEPFYQIEKARTPGDSHGLGLAICRRIVRAHGGEVTVRSQPGQGATFGIALPGSLSHDTIRGSDGILQMAHGVQ